MKTKKWLSGLLAAAMIVTSVPIGQVEANETVPLEEQEAVAASLGAIEDQVESIEVSDVTLVENTGGYSSTEYNPETGNYDLEYYYYNQFPQVTVMFKDGSTATGQYSIMYNNEYYYTSVSTDQSYKNQWGVGKHKAELYLFGKIVEFNYIIEESPVVSVEIEDVQLVEHLNGYWIQTGVSEPGSSNPAEEVFIYYCNPSEFSITFNDGTTMKSRYGNINYEGVSYSVSVSFDAQTSSPWKVGENTATGMVGGVSATFNVEVLENPIESISVQDISIPAYSNGYWTGGGPGSPDSDKFFYYEVTPNITVTYKNGHVEENVSSITYAGNTYWVNCQNDQWSSPWGVGEHEVTAELMGKQTTFTVEITESQFESVEVMKVRSVEENKNCRKSEAGHMIYDLPTFSYKVNKKDGTSFTGIYDTQDEFDSLWDGTIQVIDTQEETPWTVGGDNSFILKYGDVETIVPVEVKASEGENAAFTYVEQGGELYITSCSVMEDTIEIPESIDGKKVVGLISLKGVEDKAKKVLIPDSIQHLGKEVFNYWWDNLEVLEIGSGVKYLDADMLGGVYGCKITISEDNPYYCVIEGNVYDKEVTTLVAFINSTYITEGRAYEVPATVTNIDEALYYGAKIIFSEDSTAYVTEDGVTYSADKKRVIYCDPDKTGSYIMPDSVEEIGKGVFSNSGLTDVTISNSVTEIVYQAFLGSAIENVKLPDKLKSIGEGAFEACGNLESIELPSGLESIGENAFATSDLAKVIIPDSVIEIGDSAFAYTQIKDIIFGKKLKAIGDYAFYRAEIKELEIPDNVTHIGDGAFSYCTSLEEVTVGKGVNSLIETFSGSENLRKVELKNENVLIGGSTFAGCPIETINMEHVKGEIGLNAFERTNLEEVTLAEGVTELVYMSFAHSVWLETIDVPTSLAKVGGRAFEGTKWDKSQENGPVYLENIFYEYKGTTNEDTLKIKEGTTVLADYSLQNQDALETVVLPKGLKTIGDATFFGDSNIKEISIPASVSYIGVGAFAQCESLEAIYVDSANPYFSSVDGVLFNKDKTELIWCPKRTGSTYEVPTSVELIKKSALSECGVENIVIKNKDVVFEKFAIGFGYSSISGAGGTDQYNCNLVTIHCFEDSTAQAYAEKYLMNVVLMEEKPITSVELSKTQVQLEVGQSTVLTATINPEDTTDDKTLIWKSSNPSVATVDGGTIKTVGIGTTTITVTTSNGRAAQCVVKVSVKAEWKKDQNGWWYQREDGSYPKNQWFEIDGNWYYFNGDGYRAENQWVGSYYVNSDGVMVKNQWVGAYYIGADGQYISSAGWLEIDGKWYYLNYGGARITGWQAVGGTWYYFDTKGVMATGEKTIGGTGYYFLSSGAMATGWQTKDGDWYYYAGSGAMATGWQAIGGTWYYFDAEGVMATGEKTIGGTGYYFLSSGAMATGWQAKDGDWYYYAGSGAMCKDWQAIGGTWYYFDAEGVMLTGKKTIGGAEYYFLSSGAMTTGWQVIGGKWYYFAGSGAMVKNQWVGNYYMLEDGVMATNQWIGNYYVGADGVWQPNARK